MSHFGEGVTDMDPVSRKCVRGAKERGKYCNLLKPRLKAILAQCFRPKGSSLVSVLPGLYLTERKSATEKQSKFDSELEYEGYESKCISL